MSTNAAQGDISDVPGNPPVLASSLSSSNIPSVTSPKAVTIFDEPEHIEAPTRYTDDQPPNLTSSSPKLHRASIGGKKMTGRPPIPHVSSTASLTNTLSNFGLDGGDNADFTPNQSALGTTDQRSLLAQVTEWLKEEKSKRAAPDEFDRDQKVNHDGIAPGSKATEQNLALEKLERILAGYTVSSSTPDIRPSRKNSIINTRRGSIAKIFKRSATQNASSDTEVAQGDIHVPHVEAYLDNTKTMAFSGGEADADVSDNDKQKDQKHWDQFKQDIVRMTHTLKIRGWRRIPIDKASVISVERLSGALTNAVYVVKPPRELPEIQPSSDGSKPYIPKSRPLELLLRVYGPQAEHLIDRETELLILRRLARKKIGPRLLGYFTNGRFEEFFHAETLKPGDLRVPHTSKQIAKRMRELHDGIELLPSEIDGGPCILLNWDKSVGRCEKVITWLDKQVKMEENGQKPASMYYTKQGFVCGVEWPIFRKAFESYRKRLIHELGGKKGFSKHLIFAHNDTQYGNLMRLEPPGNSPLIQPANQHRQLVVIDFEYAGANTRGYEFANHFTEWCYDYHHPETSYACNTNRYPTLPEQYRFMHAYVTHRPQFAPSASSTPKMEGREKTNISGFMLDARTPGSNNLDNYDAEEKAREEQVEKEIQRLLQETKLWRIINSANWVAWGIIQAKIPELEEPPKRSRAGALLDRMKNHLHPLSDPLDADVKALQDASKHDRPETREKEEAHAEGSDDGEEVEEFDCLAYAHERAMLFWGDCLQMGVVKESDLPETLLKKVKLVKY